MYHVLMFAVLQCKKELVNHYQAKLAQLNVQSERRVTKSAITDVSNGSLEISVVQSPQTEAVDDVVQVTSPKITPVRKRLQTSRDSNVATRKSARLAGKNS